MCFVVNLPQLLTVLLSTVSHTEIYIYIYVQTWPNIYIFVTCLMGISPEISATRSFSSKPSGRASPKDSPCISLVSRKEMSEI